MLTRLLDFSRLDPESSLTKETRFSTTQHIPLHLPRCPEEWDAAEAAAVVARPPSPDFPQTLATTLISGPKTRRRCFRLVEGLALSAPRLPIESP